MHNPVTASPGKPSSSSSKRVESGLFLKRRARKEGEQKAREAETERGGTKRAATRETRKQTGDRFDDKRMRSLLVWLFASFVRSLFGYWLVGWLVHLPTEE